MIHIYDKLYLTADEHSYQVGTLAVRTDKETGEETPYLRDITYHPSVAMAVQSVIQRRLRDSVKDGRITTLHGVCAALRALNDELKEILQSVAAEGERVGWNI